LALKQFYIKNVGPAKIQKVQPKIPGCWTYVQQNENKFQKVCIMVTSFSGGRSWRTRREPPTMGKQLVNFITCGCESSASFFVNYKAGREPTPYW
jgi:hypothetical protein